MAGRGPAPKPRDQRVRHGDKVLAEKILVADRVKQPRLPSISLPVDDGEGGVRFERFKWPTVTKRWWKMWAESPLSKDFTATDWDFLTDTALIHARYWLGDLKLAAELRLRVAKFGATPEDRLRLRIEFADQADVSNSGETRVAGGARARKKQSLKAVK